jgi:hypothetical protein
VHKQKDKARALDAATQSQMKEMRPDVIGGITAWHSQNGRFTSAIYFTSESEARAKRKRFRPPLNSTRT